MRVGGGAVGWEAVARARLIGLWLGLFAALLLPAPASAQDDSGDAGLISDTVFVEKQRPPIPYVTSYDRNLSRGAWMQSLGYTLQTKRIAFNASGSATTVNGLRGLESDGVEGGIQGSLSLRATRLWLWSLDGVFSGVNQDADRSSTKLNRNRLQLRTQYTFQPARSLSATALIFGELQQSQSIGDQSIPNATYAKHTGRDSSFTSGTKRGASGSATWHPARGFEFKAAGSANRFRQVTNTLSRDLFLGSPTQADSVAETTTRSDTPNEDERIETSVRYTGITGMNTYLSFTGSESDLEYYVLTRRDTEQFSLSDRRASLTSEYNLSQSLQFALAANAGRSFRSYALQTNLRSLMHTASFSSGLLMNRVTSKASVRFDVGRTENDLQASQNGVTISRMLNVSGGKKVSKRLWLDGLGTASLFSRSYTDKLGDRDDARGYVNLGGGYLVSPRCSTAVHFSINRTHAVAIHPSSSGLNNVQTAYQMDANLRLRATQTLSVIQFYQLNANYFIYDYDEQRNTLSRIRRIDTILTDSLFTFAFLRLNHNFFFVDRGSYVRPTEGGDRTYRVVQESYTQNLGVTVGIQPLEGVTFTATQSLANTRNYYPNPALNSNVNRWNLNFGMDVVRSLPGAMSLQGSVQRIDEFTEQMANEIVPEAVGYWIAGITFTKDF